MNGLAGIVSGAMVLTRFLGGVYFLFDSVALIGVVSTSKSEVFQYLG